MEMTTGMSAPPMGTMISAPNARAHSVIAQNRTGSPPEPQNQKISTTISTARPALMR